MKTNRNFWPLGVIAVFILFFAGMASVVVIASTHREHLVSDNYYEQELKYQSHIDDASRARNSGASIISVVGSSSIVITLPVAQLAQKLSGTIELYRPADPKLDRVFPLAPNSDGTQVLNASKLNGGLWLVRVQWNAGGESYFLEQKITAADR